MPYDRNEVLARTDLGELADQLVGPHKGHGTSATWPCPDPGHGTQTGKTPPVSTFRTNYGDERWRCHSCGAGGTAIDLVMTTQGVRFPEAIELLARRAGVGAVDQPVPRLRTAQIQRPEPAPPATPSPEVERFVAAAESHLWSEQGQPMQRWLADRGLGEEILRANRVGADPGPAGLDRARGLPRGGPAVVLPVLGPGGEAAYLQSRYLDPDGHKYDNPAAALAGPLPRVAEVRLPRPPADPSVVVISEGIPDALVAAQAGHRTAAVLGAGVPDEKAAATLTERFPTERLVVAFDADGPGQAGAERLQELLGDLGAEARVTRLEVPEAAGDLNGWQQLAGPDFDGDFSRAMARATETERTMTSEPTRSPDPSPNHGPNSPQVAAISDHAAQGQALDARSIVVVDSPGADDAYVGITRGEPSPAAPAPEASAAHGAAAEEANRDLVERLETIHYHHVLLDDPRLAAANVGRVEQAVGSWSDPTLPHPTAALAPAPEMAALDQRLEQVAYRHVLVDDPDLAGRNLGTLRSGVEEWSTEVATFSHDATAVERDGGVDTGWTPEPTDDQRWAFEHGLSPEPGLEAAGLDMAIDF